MDIGYSEEQETTRKMVRDFAKNELSPQAEERDKTGEFPYQLYQRLADLGITAMRFPAEYGGTESSFLAYCLAVEEIARVDLSLATTLFVSVAAGIVLLDVATEEQKQEWKDKWIIPVAEGKIIPALASTEPGGGSDTMAIKTTAIRDASGMLVVNGSKMFITNAGLDNCPYVLVVAITDKKKRDFGNVLIPTGTPGYTIMPKLKKMGLKSSDTRELIFDDCRIPAINLVGLGVSGDGRRYFIDQCQGRERCATASAALGTAEACLEQSLDYARSRAAFGKTISKFQYVQSMLVDMALENEMSRLLRDKFACLVDQGTIDMKLSAMAKYFCCESAKRVADWAVQIYGGMGVMDECAISRYYRDIRAYPIVDGTSEIQKYIVAREMGC